MIILSAGCASLASLMREDAAAGPTAETTRAPVETDGRPRLISTNGGDQGPAWVSPPHHSR
ncbi:hypothetical protein [Brevundimonas sp. NPDC058933]|uniref:hypothetical protein n=1 Tax=Brevundimonas sp. NPDC058933 TaxID=3346673 RepID=UPI003BEF3085